MYNYTSEGNAYRSGEGSNLPMLDPLTGCNNPQSIEYFKSIGELFKANHKNEDDKILPHNSIPLLTNLSLWESNKMSLIHARICSDGVVFISDSRSSRKDVDDNYLYDDNYTKIYYSQSKKVILSSAGLNEFDGLNFTQVCTAADNSNSNSQKFIEEVVMLIDFCVKRCDQDAQIIATNTIDFNQPWNESFIQLCSYELHHHTDTNRISSLDVGSAITYGVPWIQKFFMTRDTPLLFTADQYLNESTHLLAKCIEFSQKNDDPCFVGGNVHGIAINDHGDLQKEINIPFKDLL